MKIAKIILLLFGLLLLSITCLCQQIFPLNEPTNYHQVGGCKGWTTNVNYTEWASDKQFMVGDCLMFVYDSNLYDVLEVTQSGYDFCDDQDFLSDVTEAEIVRLKEAKSYYFISNRDRCLQGFKLAINVKGKYQIDTPPPPPQPEYSSANTCTLNMILISLLKLILWAMVSH